VEFESIGDSENQDLCATFNEDEVKEVVWECGRDKSLGFNGFNFHFIKKCWGFKKGDFMNMVGEFWEHGKIPSSGNPSFITLIPKKENAQRLGDYRPISLIRCVYKIIAIFWLKG